MRIARLLTFVAAISAMALLSDAQEAPGSQGNDTSNVLVIYDSSNSMWGELSDRSRKYEAARGALTEFLNHGVDDRLVGLRAYGHRTKDDCRDSDLVRTFEPAGSANTSIESLVQSIRPKGMTPITYSLTEGLKDLGGSTGDILLISDGVETCDADPCELMEAWKAEGVTVRVHVVGVGLKDVERQSMACIADASGGQYFDADSEIAFNAAMGSARNAMGAPAVSASEIRFAILLDTVDNNGEALRGGGEIISGSEVLGPVTSRGYGRNAVPGAGEYVIEAGALLQDGSVYRPVRTSVEVSTPGDTALSMVVPRPASVSAKFSTEDADHSGALVRAYQDGKEAFSFRPVDVAFAREGTYEFRTQTDTDNVLTVTRMFIDAEHTEINFDLIPTIQTHVNFRLPNGDIIRRQSELWRGGEKLYTLQQANGATIRPGTYELRADDQNLPLTPVEISLTEDGKTVTVPLAAGFLTVIYGGNESDYVGNADRAFLESLDRGGSSFLRPDAAVPVAAGTYRINPFDRAGHFDPVDITIAAGESRTVTIVPKPLGELVIEYAPSDAYKVPPDRASISALEGQSIIGGILKPGVVRKLLPGRYRIEGWRNAGEFDPQEVTVVAGTRQTVTLHLRNE